MVVPIRDFGNITSPTAAICPTTLNMSPNNNMNMIVNLANDFFEKNCDIHDEVRGHSLVHSVHCPRTPSLSSSECDKNYATRVQRESNRIVEDNTIAPSDSPLLEYAASKSQNNQVSKVANPTTNARQQCAVNVGPALNNKSTNSSNKVNIQLSYNINQALDFKSWDSNFNAILLHRFMKHLASDVKNIKDSLIRMYKYILGKAIKGDKANSVKDLKNVSKAVWESILSLYKAY